MRVDNHERAGLAVFAAAAAALAALAALAMGACGGNRGPASSPPATEDAGVGRLDPAEAEILAGGFRDTLEAMVAVVRARTGVVCAGGDAGVAAADAGRCADCNGMATDLGAVFDRSEPLFARAREVGADPESARIFDQAMKSQERGVPGLIDEIAAGLAPCAGHGELIRTMERMPVL